MITSLITPAFIPNHVTIANSKLCSYKTATKHEQIYRFMDLLRGDWAKQLKEITKKEFGENVRRL